MAGWIACPVQSLNGPLVKFRRMEDYDDAFEHACEVDVAGVTIVETTTMERAELKRDQIKAYGKDPLLKDSPGSMYASIEPAE